MAKALKIQLLNNCSAALCSKSLHLPACPKIPRRKLQLVAPNDVLIVDALINYTVSNTKKAILYRLLKYNMA